MASADAAEMLRMIPPSGAILAPLPRGRLEAALESDFACRGESVGLRARLANDLAPFDDFRLHVVGGLLLRAAHRVERAESEPLAYLGVADGGIDRLVELLHDRRRRARGDEHADPGVVLHAGKARFRESRDIRERRDALRAGDGEGAKLPGLDLRQRS